VVTEQAPLSFGGLLRQLRAEARLTQEELAEAARLSPRGVSALERGVNRTARKDTAELLAGALGLAAPARELFVAAARGKLPAGQVLPAVNGAQPQPRGAVTASPYRGLAAFEEQHTAYFFGRDTAADEVLDRMSRRLGGAGWLVVSGVSGAGKSSLLRAGVLSRIRQSGLAAAPEAASWPYLVLTPTRNPLDELALRVAPLAGADAAAVRRGLEADPGRFALTVRQAATSQPDRPGGDSGGSAAGQDQPPRQRRLLLVVDQFEEVFTQCAEEGQRRAFITALHAAATAGHGPDNTPAGLVVLAVRADFEARCAEYRQLADAIQGRYLVTAMTERQLRVAITEPARKAGSKVDDDLVGVLLAELRNGQPGTFAAGVLPLLSHALDQSWRCRTGQTVTLAGYERTGGIEGAVAASAQRAYDQLTPGQQAAARQVFLRLTATSSDGVDIADRATRAELTEGNSAAGTRDVEVVLEAFAAERLLTLAAGTVEISHEALLTAWPLLRDTWLADSHADRIVRTRLHNTAADWERSSRDPSYLYTGTLLQAATEIAARIDADPARNPALSQVDRNFLQASRRRRIRGRGLLTATIVALIVFLGFMTATDVAGWRAASELQNFQAATRLSLATAGVADRLAAERTAAAMVRLRPGAQAQAGLGAAQRDVNRALRQAQDSAADWHGSVDAAGRLAVAREKLAALRLRVAGGSLSVPDISASYGTRVNDLIGTVGDLIEDRPPPSSGQTPDAYLAMLQAIEAAQRERVDVAAVLGAPRDQTALDQITATSRWATLEGAELGTFRRNAPGRLAAGLDAVLRTPAGIAVRTVRDDILARPRAAVAHTSLEGWLNATGTRIGGLGRLESGTGRDLATTASRDLHAARAGGLRNLGLLLAVLSVVTALGLVPRRWITRPLREVSASAHAVQQ
jgi:transcriptional regulator with XRE-family HTH domain